MIACAIAIIFSCICCIAPDNYTLVLICKGSVGISAGMFNVYCPKFIMECAPKEISGIAGASFQILVCSGIWCNAIIGLIFGNDALKKETEAETAFIVFNLPPIVFSLM